MEKLCCPLLCPCSSSVISSRGRRRGVPSKGLHDGDVGAGIEEVTNPGATEIVGGEVPNANAPTKKTKTFGDGLIGHATNPEGAALTDRHEQRRRLLRHARRGGALRRVR
jgi:hypothetical protein